MHACDVSCDMLSKVRHSSAALLQYLSSVSSSVKTLALFSQTLLRILESHKQDTRVIQPLLKTLDLLLSNGVLDVYTSLDT